MRDGPTYRKAPRRLGGRRGAVHRDLYTDTHCTTVRPVTLPPERREPARSIIEVAGLSAMAFAFTWCACYLCGVAL